MYEEIIYTHMVAVFISRISRTSNNDVEVAVSLVSVQVLGDVRDTSCSDRELLRRHDGGGGGE